MTTRPFPATGPIGTLKSADVPENELDALDALIENLGDTPLARFLNALSNSLRNGSDVVVIAS